MRQLIVRFLNVAVIAAVLIGYNTVLDKRDKEDQIARLSAELETTQLQKENLQAAAAASNTADTAASEAAEAEGQYVDGTYDGEADGFGGTIVVEATVEGGQIPILPSHPPTARTVRICQTRRRSFQRLLRHSPPMLIRSAEQHSAPPVSEMRRRKQ